MSRHTLVSLKNAARGLAKHRLISSTLIVLVCVILPTMRPIISVYAYTPDDYTSIYNDTPWYDPNAGLCSAAGAGGVAGAGGGGGNFAPPTSLPGNGNVQQAFLYFTQQKGLTALQAAGIIGNLEQESGQGLDPHAVQPGGPGRGIAQWSAGGRWDSDHNDNLVNFYIPKYSPGASQWDLKMQLGFLWYELGTFYSTTLQHLKASTTVEDAVSQFAGPLNAYTGQPVLNPAEEVARSGGFEDPGTPVMANRISNAKKVLAQSNGSTSTAGASSGCGTFNGSCTVTSSVYLYEYSQDQLAKIFGDPGTASSHPALHLTTVKFLGFSAEVSPLVAPCLQAVSNQLQAENETYKVHEFGCYRYDSNNGTSNIGLKSYHTYGAACDINWDTNPFVESGADTPHDMPDQFIQAFKAHGFTWGGDWHQPKDYMHFEWHGVKPPS